LNDCKASRSRGEVHPRRRTPCGGPTECPSRLGSSHRVWTLSNRLLPTRSAVGFLLPRLMGMSMIDTS
jgi:hypothetical protein